MKDLKELIPLSKLIKEDKVKLIIASLFIFIAELSEICTGYLNGAAVEAISNLKIKEALLFLGTYGIINIVASGLILTQANAVLQKIESKLTRKLGYFTYKKALDLPAEAYEKTSSGEIINRITNDADTLSFTFGQLLRMFSSLLGSLILIVYIFMNSYVIGIYITLFILILFLVLKKYNPILKNNHKERKKGQDKFTSLTTESIRGVREIKTLGVKKSLLEDMKEIIKEIFDKSSKEIDIRKKFNLITRFIKVSLEVGTFILCVILLYYKEITLTFFIAMTYYVYRYMWLIENINELSQTYQKVIVSIGRVNEILENKLSEDEQFGTKEITKSKGIVEFKDVVFGYPNEDIILKGFNITLEPNKKIAIVGQSGQGKSTLFNLLTRVFEPKSGKILLDKQELKDLTLDQIRKYTKLAYLDDYIMSLPDQYDTLLGESGVNLSGGQKQRLSIARTLAKESKVILFDEATSALDNESQAYIKQAIDNLVKDHTVVIVAHRLSTIIDADIIYVIDKGKIADKGTHEELLKTSKIYKKLYTTEALNS